MNPDFALLKALNSLAGRAPAFDAIVCGISQSNLTKGLLLMPVLWWLWTRKDGKLIRKGSLLVQSLIGLAVCIVIGRVLQSTLPLRIRPIDDPGLGLFIIPEAHGEGFHDASSFPSDHAIVFVALSAIIWTQSRIVGAAAYLWTAIFILLPRVYLGLHYPSDILVGAIIGILVISFSLRIRTPLVIDSFGSYMQERHPGLLSALIFFISTQIAVLFDDIRHAASGLAKIFGSH